MSKPKYRGGRRSKFSAAVVSKVIAGIERGLPLTLAARRAGIADSTFFDWRRRRPEFDSQVEQAALKGIESRLQVIEQASRAGDWRAAAWLLERANSEFFGKQKIEVSHQHAHAHLSFSVPPGVLDEISRARRAYEKRSIDVTSDQKAD